MFKLWISIKKDLRIITRDRVGLLFMFAMPILLAIVITAIQNSTFQLVNENKVTLMVCNKDTGQAGRQLLSVIENIGMFTIHQLPENEKSETVVRNRMRNKEALVAIVIPSHFTYDLQNKAKYVSG
jgi:ABC-2 type transport system permease protein